MMGQGSWLEANLELRRRRDEMDAHKFLENSRVTIGRDAVVASVEAYLADLRSRGPIYDQPIFFVDASPEDVLLAAGIDDTIVGRPGRLLLADEHYPA